MGTVFLDILNGNLSSSEYDIHNNSSYSMLFFVLIARFQG